MRYCELLELAPGLEEYTRQIPEELDGQFQLKTYPAHALIHLSLIHISEPTRPY